MRQLVTLFVFLQAVHINIAALITQKLDISWKTTNPDGHDRRVIVINGYSPGPTIKCMLGDTLEVTVLNNLDIPVAVHWHGILQIGSPEMDGVPGITQKAIFPKGTYVYKFKPTSPGTFWYHSHFHTEYVDGLRGALIVVDPKAKQYARDSVVMLSEWFEKESETLLKNVMLKPGSTSVEPNPVSGLIGGLGQRLGSACSKGSPTTCVTTATAGSPTCKAGEKPQKCLFKRFQAQAGGSCANPTTKLRFINGAGYTGFSVSIDEHLMQIVSADLMPVKPVTVGTLYINVGQRYEVLVCRKTNPTSTAPAWIRVHMEGLNMVSKLKNKDFLGILLYQNVSADATVIPKTKADPVLFSTNVAKVYPQVPITIDPLKRLDLDPTGLELVNPPPLPPKADRRINVTISYMPDDKTVMKAYVNGVSFNADLTGGPLLPLLKPGVPFKTPIPGLQLDWIKKGQVVDFFIKNLDYRIHPLHMHGYDVWIMARGQINDLPKLKKYPTLLAKPLMRDVVTVMPQSYLVLRIKADNPGVWLLHCHVEWHIATGMVTGYHVY